MCFGCTEEGSQPSLEEGAWVARGSFEGQVTRARNVNGEYKFTRETAGFQMVVWPV